MHEKLEDAKKHAQKAKDKARKIREKVGENYLYIISLVPVLLIGLYVRTRNLKWLRGKYMLGLDPYLFYRHTGYIVEHGQIMAHDALRGAPLGASVNLTVSFFSYWLAYLYKPFQWLGVDRMTFHIWYPAIAGVAGFVFLFLFIRELFGNKIALVSTAFAAVIPAYIYRTGAGFADHEALAMVFMFASLWLFAKSWNSEKLGRCLALGAGSGLLAGFMVPSWGGYKFLFAAVGLLVILSLLFTDLEDKRIYSYLIWIVPAILFVYLRRGGFLSILKGNYDILLLLFAAISALVYLGLKKTDYAKDIKEKISLGGASVFGVGLLGIIGLLITGIGLNKLYMQLLNPMKAGRLSATVSENAAAFFKGGNGLMSSFGLTIFLVLIGAILLFYNIFKGNKKYAGWLTFGWIVVLATFILRKYRPGASINSKASTLFMPLTLLFIAGFLATYFYTYNKDREIFNKVFKADWKTLFLFGWFVFSLVIAVTRVRTIFAFAPVAAVVAGYFVVKTVKWCWQDKKKVFGVLFIIFVLVFCFVPNVQSAEKISKGSGSGFPGQWEQAMNWIKNNTPEDSIFMHWWDYGYWTQTEGERASITDGGHAGNDYAVGRWGLLGRDYDTYMTYYNTLNVTHLLISEEEISKFHAFSKIGSEKNAKKTGNWDLRSTIGIFFKRQERAVRNGTQLIYNGGWRLDKDYVVDGKVLEKGKNYVDKFKFNMRNNTLTGAQVIFNDGTEAPLKTLCQAGKCQTINPDGFGGSLILKPYFKSNTKSNPIGAAFFASEKVEDTLLVNIYLKGQEVEGFKQVYSDGTPLGIYRGRIIGPIKIWEVNPPDRIGANPKHLENIKGGLYRP